MATLLVGAPFLGPTVTGAAMAGGTAGLFGSAGVFSLGTALSTIGTIGGLMGSMQQARGQDYSAQAAARAAEYNAQVARNNAVIAEQNRTWAGQEGLQRVQQQQMKTRAEVAGLKAQQAASGVRLDSPSFVDVRSTAKELGELSALDIRTKTARQAYGYDVEEMSHLADAGLAESRAASEIAAGKIQSSATILGGLSKAATGFSDYLDARSF